VTVPDAVTTGTVSATGPLPPPHPEVMRVAVSKQKSSCHEPQIRAAGCGTTWCTGRLMKSEFTVHLSSLHRPDTTPDSTIHILADETHGAVCEADLGTASVVAAGGDVSLPEC